MASMPGQDGEVAARRRRRTGPSRARPHRGQGDARGHGGADADPRGQPRGQRRRSPSSRAPSASSPRWTAAPTSRARPGRTGRGPRRYPPGRRRRRPASCEPPARPRWRNRRTSSSEASRRRSSQATKPTAARTPTPRLTRVHRARSSRARGPPAGRRSSPTTASRGHQRTDGVEGMRGPFAGVGHRPQRHRQRDDDQDHGQDEQPAPVGDVDQERGQEHAQDAAAPGDTGPHADRLARCSSGNVEVMTASVIGMIIAALDAGRPPGRRS